MIAIRTAALLSIAAVLLTPALLAQSADSAPASRALASPLDSPPFPSADWVGGPIIGQPDATPDYPLQKALFGNSLAASRIKIYGWIDLSGNVSTSDHSNAPVSPNVVPNAVELEQAILRIDRYPNTVQTAHADWGFRFTSLYGIDYRLTTAKGWFSDQLLQHNDLYGYDPVELYGLLYLPHVAQGMMLKVGRFGSPPDVEDPFAPDNFFLSHALTASVDPVTFTGAEAIVRLSPQWAFTAGIDAGSDMAPWQNSAQLNGQLMVRWVSPGGGDGLWGGVNAIGNGVYKNGHDNLQQAALTWGHRFSAKVNMQTEVWYIWQFDAAKGGSCNYGPVKPYGGGGGCGPIIPGRSESVAAANYFAVGVSPKDLFAFRLDYLNDAQGQRTGYATPYGTVTAGWEHWLWPLAFLRGEVRYDNAFSSTLTPYDNGTKRDQTVASLDLMVRF